MAEAPHTARLDFRPLTPATWVDLERLFGGRGACGGCWCMWWRITRKEFEESKGETNRASFKELVDAGVVPGILAYEAEEPVGWCAIEPRVAYSVLARSRVLRPVDDLPVWAVTCFFVARSRRDSGLSGRLLEAALEHARRSGAKVVEGYPVEPRKDSMPEVFAWTGFASTFRDAGFEEIARRSASRPIMRLELTA